MLSQTELIIRAVRKARDGKPVSESKVYEDNAELQIMNARRRVGRKMVTDGARRDLLWKTYNATVTLGKVDLSAFPDLLVEGLPWSVFYDADDPDRIRPYIFKRHPGELNRYLNPEFGYTAQEDGFLITRRRGDADPVSSKISTPGPATLICSAFPDFTSATFPDVLNDMAVDELVTCLLELRA